MTRKLKRGIQRRAQKSAKKVAKDIERQIGRMGTTCRGCSADFDRTSDTHLDTWRVEVYDDRVDLLCPECQSAVVQ